MTLASARDTIRILSWLKANAAHMPADRGRQQGPAGVAEISKADFEASIERKIDFTIPFDAKAAANAAKLGQTFADANRSAKAGARSVIAETVMGVGEGDVIDDKAKAKSSLLGKFDLKGVLGKKPKPADKAPATAKA
jgi:pilus assembly protein CpaE